MHFKTKQFSAGKTKDKNEDCVGYTSNTIVVADGASDVTGEKYKGKTGGEIASSVVVKSCLSTTKNGYELIRILNQNLKEKFKKYTSGSEYDLASGPAATVVCARISKEEIVITQLGDTMFRINENRVYKDNKLIDELITGVRINYISKTNDLKHSRDLVIPLVKYQRRFLQNNKNHPLGYGVIDGGETPRKFIKAHKFKLQDVKTIEIFTDGYFAIPKKASIGAWEKMHQQVEKEDPYKYKKYKSTKPKDDRTIVVASANL